MKIKDGFELHDILGEQVVIPTGIENIDFNHLVSLNETASLLWRKAQELGTFTASDLAAALTAEYEVEPAQAEADVRALLVGWEEQGLLEGREQ